MVPILDKVPAVYAAAPEQVKLKVAKSIVPAVWVYVVHDNAAAKVTVLAPLLITNAAIVLPAGVIVPVPTIVIDKLVYVPPLAKVKLFKFNEVVAGVQVLPVKSNILNQLPVVIVGIEAPDVIARLGALVVEPPVVPNVNVLVTDIVVVNPPVPV